MTMGSFRVECDECSYKEAFVLDIEAFAAVERHKQITNHESVKVIV